jgi:hypothetical protein
MITSSNSFPAAAATPQAGFLKKSFDGVVFRVIRRGCGLLIHIKENK